MRRPCKHGCCNAHLIYFVRNYKTTPSLLTSFLKTNYHLWFQRFGKYTYSNPESRYFWYIDFVNKHSPIISKKKEKKKRKMYIRKQCYTPVVSKQMYVDFSLSYFNASLMSSRTSIIDEQLQHTIVVSYHDVLWASK